MPATPAEPTTERPRHRHGCPSPAVRARSGSASHARGSHPCASLPHAAVLAERARIARDLHDSVSQTLYAISLGASRARGLLQQDDGTQLQRMLDDLLHLANAGQAELRALVTGLRSDQLTSGGLTAGLATLAEDVRTRSGLSVHLSLDEEPDVPAATREELVLIVREALHNVVRHSSANRVHIVLKADEEGLTLLITDDGCGFDPAKPRTGHFGLHSMRERATAVGGTLTLTSAVGRGTQVRVSLPRAGGHLWMSYNG